MSKWYGSLTNRLEENKNYLHRDIQVGDDITEYLWSDRHCYYVTRVENQKHIFVKPYQVCADRESGPMSNVWKYFKTEKEMNQYLNSYHIKDLKGNEIHYNENPIESEEEEWVFRYNNWYKVRRYDSESITKCLELTKKDSKHNEPLPGLMRYYLGLTDSEYIKLQNKGTYIKYFKIPHKLSFGIRDYYYDFEF